MTQDEFFVTADAAKSGIVIKNESATENMVFLKHFAPRQYTGPDRALNRGRTSVRHAGNPAGMTPEIVRR